MFFAGWHRGIALAVLGPSVAAAALAQTEPLVGIRSNTPRVHALEGARVAVAPGKVLARATVVVREGLIVAVGPDVKVPDDARVHDCRGLSIWPGLIESWLYADPEASRHSVPQSEEHAHGHVVTPQAPRAGAAAGRGGRHWNPRVHPERRAADAWHPTQKELQELRALGFACALIVPSHGIFRGSSALVSLSDGSRTHRILAEDVGQHLAFDRSGSRTDYPNSLMGVIALIRQTLLDADWHRRAHAAYARNPKQERPERNAALEALAKLLDRRQPAFCEVRDDLDLLRALAIGREFDLDLRIKGSGHEYRRLGAMRGASLIVPVTYPPAPAVMTPEEALDVSLRDLSHWERAPENPARLFARGIAFSLTSAGLEKREEFWRKVREAVERGLPAEEALRALTETPARMLGVADRLGTIEAGKIANLVITDGDLFAEKTKVRATWVDGRPYVVTRGPPVEVRGSWSLRVGERELRLAVTGDEDHLRGEVSLAGAEPKQARRVRLDARRLALVLPGAWFGREDGVLRLTGLVDGDRIEGRGEWPDGAALAWQAKRSAPAAGDPAAKVLRPGPLPDVACEVPEGAFGRRSPPAQQDVLLRGATIWTCDAPGKLAPADMLIRDGKIVAIGERLACPEGVRAIDASGKHVTPGLIDAHSHTAISGGVNESAQAVTAEVRIEDVINPDDVNIYRQLAGGLTCANLLHGSANPIGGQTCVVKWRWGSDPEGLKFKAAAPGIKFALGENVKQSNWGDSFTNRYPQTRMGVEQILRDRFHAAREHARRRAEQRPDSLPVRRDLELEALIEVLRGTRKIHCHSYRQDEILMLIRVAEDFGFKVGTFQHVLEGYKIAEAIAKHGAHASSFSDWWAYKYEVIDAIPYNGAILHKVGVLTSFNSDSAELARRMNTEAAKAVKYGGVSEEDALAFVTLHAARQLEVDERVGSLAEGKDADFVVWNGHPLSTLTRCEQTWIEGRKFFDREEDRREREHVVHERARLVQEVLQESEKEKQRRREKMLQRLGAEEDR